VRKNFERLLQFAGLQQCSINVCFHALQCAIEGYHDPMQRVIYLHMRGVFDVHTLIKSYDLFSKELEEKVRF
jgi:hypothetical protein